MKKDDISRLLQRYLSAREMGKEPYFDADEVDELLGSFEESDNYDYFDEVLALGLKLPSRVIQTYRSDNANSSFIMKIITVHWL